MLEAEYKYYQDHKTELLGKYTGKFIVIKGETVDGPFSTQEEALKAALEKHEAGTFLIQKCVNDDQDEMRFYSRVSFASHGQSR